MRDWLSFQRYVRTVVVDEGLRVYILFIYERTVGTSSFDSDIPGMTRRGRLLVTLYVRTYVLVPGGRRSLSCCFSTSGMQARLHAGQRPNRLNMNPLGGESLRYEVSYRTAV